MLAEGGRKSERQGVQSYFTGAEVGQNKGEHQKKFVTACVECYSVSDRVRMLKRSLLGVFSFSSQCTTTLSHY